MPYYEFKNKETGEMEMHLMSYDEGVEYAKNNDLYFMPASPRICSGYGDVFSKVDDYWTDRMKEIKKSHPLGNIQTK